MHHLLKLSILISGLMYWLGAPLHAAVSSGKSISAFIESARRNSEILVNSPKYDRKAKVYYLCYLGYNVHEGDKLAAAVNPMVPVYRQIQHSGAELILYLDFPPEQTNADSKNKRNSKKHKLGEDSEISCPIINIFHSTARSALFKKDDRGKEHSYGTYELRAVDAKGTPLYYFSRNQDDTIMLDARTGEKKTIDTGSYTGNAWIGPAILASYKEPAAQKAPDETDSDNRKTKRKTKKKAAPKNKGK